MAEESNHTPGDGNGASQGETEASSSAPGQSLPKADRSKRPKRGYFSKAANWVSLLTLIFVAIYTGITAVIWLDARQTNIYNNRASVALSEAQWISMPGAVDFVPLWENTGNVPTIGMKAHVNWRVTVNALPVGFSLVDELEDGQIIREPPMSLPPKSKAGPLFFGLTHKCFWDLANHKYAHFYVWGWATYHDTFSKAERITRFCWDIRRMSVDVKNFGSVGRVEYGLCDEGNCTDAECREMPRLRVALPPRDAECQGVAPAAEDAK